MIDSYFSAVERKHEYDVIPTGNGPLDKTLATGLELAFVRAFISVDAHMADKVGST